MTGKFDFLISFPLSRAGFLDGWKNARWGSFMTVYDNVEVTAPSVPRLWGPLVTSAVFWEQALWVSSRVGKSAFDAFMHFSMASVIYDKVEECLAHSWQGMLRVPEVCGASAGI